jgi:hypothetical protein
MRSLISLIHGGHDLKHNIVYLPPITCWESKFSYNVITIITSKPINSKPFINLYSLPTQSLQQQGWLCNDYLSTTSPYRLVLYIVLTLELSYPPNLNCDTS